MTAYIISQLRQRPRRAAAVVAGVALGTMLFVALSALATGFQRAARTPLTGVAADIVLTRPSGPEVASPTEQRGRGVRMPFGLATITTKEAEGLAGIEGVADAAHTLQLWDFGSKETTTVMGVDARAVGVGPGRALAGKLSAGRSFEPADRDVAVLDLHYARFYDLALGAEVRLGDQPFRVIGIVELTETSQAAAANLYVPLADAQALAGLAEDQVNQVYLEVANASEVDAVVNTATARIGRVSAITEDSLVQVMGGIGRISSRFARVASAVALAGGLLLGWFALRGLVSERRREIGLMKAVGWRRRDVTGVFLREALLLSVAGAMVGLILGFGAAALLTRLPVPTPNLAGDTQEMPGQQLGDRGGDQKLPASVGLQMAAAAVVLVAGASTLAGWTAARSAASLKPGPALTAF